MSDVQRALFDMQEVTYGDFSAKLLPTLPRERVIGVRVPLLRKYAKGMSGEEIDAFLSDLPHLYQEENYLHALLIAQMRDPDECYDALERFLPHVDNWAICDALRPKHLCTDRARLLDAIYRYIASGHAYTVRFGIELLMVYFLDEHFSPAHLDLVAGVQSKEYYVNMMIAWYFATALAEQWEQTLPYLTQHRLDAWVHQKAIQKAIESCRISSQRKAYLRTLKQYKKRV